jgi:MoaA/NifB/PqqE/SkfB family radical SAM enzyme
MNKNFPIKKGLPCQLKWNHSTVFLTMGTTASCHRVTHDPILIENGKINFHNIPNKLEARKKMLNSEWPGRGCEHCKTIEDFGGESERMTNIDFPGLLYPKELDQNPDEINVTPTQLEIYFSNTCNLKCVYCNSKFSSTIDAENARYGEFTSGDRSNWGKNVYLPGKIEVASNMEEMSNKLFDWLEDHIQDLNKIFILGGEPFLQKETERLIEFLERKPCPNLMLSIFSNLTVDPARVKKWLARMWQLKTKGHIQSLQVVGSLDCWGPEAEYVRNGLDLKKFQENFEFMLNETDIILNINSAMTALTIPSMPNLVRQINQWSKKRTVYWSMMKAGDAGRSYFNPTIFGKDILDLGINESIQLFDTQKDNIKEIYLRNLKGIANECEKTTPDLEQQNLLKIYLDELDRRRGTDWRKTFPTIAKLYKL